jgi:hypothetical protein
MRTMRLRFLTNSSISLTLFLAFTLLMTWTSAWGGMLRINMNDGKSVEVPYYWEENGEVKFEFAGGIAGVPKAQVSSIQEVLTAKEFDPEVLIEIPKDASQVDPSRRLKDFIAKQLPPMPNYETLDPEQSLQILQAESLTRKGAGTSRDVVHGPLYNFETGFAELVRVREDGVLLVMQNVLSSRTDLKKQAFTLIVYDGEGNVLQKKPCEIHEIEIDRKEKKKYEIPGHLFAVMATIKPDPKIKRFEIVSARQ